MIFLAADISGFVICIISDFVGLRAKKLATAMFLAGSIIVIAATVCTLFWRSDLVAAFQSAPVLRLLAAVGAAVFLGLKIYALVSVPKGNYTDTSVGRLVDTGLYALCRHPGSLFFAGIYLFLGLTAGSTLMWIISAVNVALEIIYIGIQDVCIFPKTIAGYREYKKQTPFLIPNKHSIKCAFRREDY